MSFHEGIEETIKMSVSITGEPIEILSKHIPNTSFDRYRYTILPGRKVCKIANSAPGKYVSLYAIRRRVSTLFFLAFIFVLSRFRHQHKEVSDSNFSVPAVSDSG
jgi:hypothetical protein